MVVREITRRLRADKDGDRVTDDLGIHYAGKPGSETGRGYLAYAEKIDWRMQRRSIGVRREDRLAYGTSRIAAGVVHLSAQIEPPHLMTGCLAVNSALRAAEERWPNLTVLDWGRGASRHPEYVGGLLGIHVTSAGATAWAQLVLEALDSFFREDRMM